MFQNRFGAALPNIRHNTRNIFGRLFIPGSCTIWKLQIQKKAKRQKCTLQESEKLSFQLIMQNCSNHDTDVSSFFFAVFREFAIKNGYFMYFEKQLHDNTTIANPGRQYRVSSHVCEDWISVAFMGLCCNTGISNFWAYTLQTLQNVAIVVFRSHIVPCNCVWMIPLAILPNTIRGQPMICVLSVKTSERCGSFIRLHKETQPKRSVCEHYRQYSLRTSDLYVSIVKK